MAIDGETSALVPSVPALSAPPPPGQTQALSRGLRMLRILAESQEPLSATELAERLGVHQSSASRILATLAEEGYVRRRSYRSFVPDYGILSLALNASHHFPIIERPRQVLVEAADAMPGMMFSLAMLFGGETIYFLRTIKGRQPVLFEATGYPLHVSSAGMLFLSDMPEAQARQLLAQSRSRSGWWILSDSTPRDEDAAIELARRSVQHECLIVDWGTPGNVTAAIGLNPYDSQPLALTINGPASMASHDELRLSLHHLRRQVEATLQGPE
ncbi:MAG: IclR family transcriptional regulator [Propionibacteriaceae bacterium]